MQKLGKSLWTAVSVATTLAGTYSLIRSLALKSPEFVGAVYISPGLLQLLYSFLIFLGIGFTLAVNWEWINWWRTRKARAEAELTRKIEHAYILIRDCYERGLVDPMILEASEARDYVNPLRKELDLAQLDPPQFCTVSVESFRSWYIYLSNLRLR